jgi:hypothetical protein
MGKLSKNRQTDQQNQHPKYAEKTHIENASTILELHKQQAVMQTVPRRRVTSNWSFLSRKHGMEGIMEWLGL